MGDIATGGPEPGSAPSAWAGAAPPSRRLILTLAALSSFGPLSSDMYLPGLPSLTRSLHASASAGNLTLTASVLGLALGQLVAGSLSDQLGRRRPLLAGLIGFALASALCAVAPSILALVALRFIQGMSGGAGIVIARAVVRDLSGGVTAARTFSTLMVITGVAPILAPLIGGGVLAVSSWRWIFLVLAVIGVCLLGVTASVVPETLALSDRRPGGLRSTLLTFRRLAGDRTFAPYCVAFACAFGAMFAYISGGSYVIENVYGASPQLFSVVFAANALGLVAISRCGAQIVDRFGPGRLLRWGLIGVCAASLAALAVAATHAGIWLMLIVLFGLVSANGFVLPNGIATAMASQPGALGSAAALLGLAQFGLGAALAPLVGLGGADDALPMGTVMAACGVVALTVNLALSS